MKPKILLIEDDLGAAQALKRVLQHDGCDVEIVPRGDDGLDRATRSHFDTVVTDLKLPGLNGLDLVRQLHGLKPRLPIILMTAHGSTETAIEATKLGAFDYLLKPFEMEQLLDLVETAVASSRLMTEPVDLGDGTSARDALVGKSRAMQEIYKEVGRIAAKPVNVLIRGETGTGKELIARAIYQHSDRANAPFVAVNCAAIPETLLESELFGHERGAFTGAEFRRIGRFEQANHGTIFLDEIGDVSLSTQTKLLRVLQEKTIQRLGSKEVIPIDVRAVAATHRDLEAAIVARQFREDLFYRLSVVVVSLPPLRDRIEDIPHLVKHFLRRYGGELGVECPAIQAEAIEFLQQQSWPGNVRELENVVRQAMLLARKYAITLEHVRQVLHKTHRGALGQPNSLAPWVAELLARVKRGEAHSAHAQAVEELERELFGQVIQLAQGNQAKAARWLGISRLTMREKLLHFGVHPGTHEP